VIRDRSQELATFHARHFGQPIGARSTDANAHHSELADEEVISLARSAKNAAKFEALWQGDISGYASKSQRS
jgi:primase-polymerase (primpol)-like protein